FLARTKALNSRAICAVSGGRSCKSFSQSVSGSVRGNCMGYCSCGREGYIFPPCSMLSFATIDSVSWRLWGCGGRVVLRHGLCDQVEGGVPRCPALEVWLGQAAPPHCIGTAESPRGMLSAVGF